MEAKVVIAIVKTCNLSPNGALSRCGTVPSAGTGARTTSAVLDCGVLLSLPQGFEKNARGSRTKVHIRS